MYNAISHEAIDSSGATTPLHFCTRSEISRKGSKDHVESSRRCGPICGGRIKVLGPGSKPDCDTHNVSGEHLSHYVMYPSFAGGNGRVKAVWY